MIRHKKGENTHNMKTITCNEPMAPPAWAVMQQELIRTQVQACEAFYNKYFDEKGYMLCVPRWGGDDGPDDAIENLTGWPLLYLLGGDEILLELCHLAQNGHIRQYTEAKTEDVPFCRDGMYYKEFPVMFDWVHNGESLSVFGDLGLCDPFDIDYERRVRMWSAFYMDEDPGAPNYDPEHRIIRSLFNGSRGPLLRKATPLDWAGDPIEEGRFTLLHGERNYEEMLAHFKDYTDVVGDHPSNMVATGLPFYAYALTGEEKYKSWLLEYVDAWVERTRANNNIIPSNIGLDGTIGGACDGKWYGGCYGWGFTTTVPQNGQLAHRNTVYLGLAGFSHAYLLTGDHKYVDVWRDVIEAVNSNHKEINGQTMYPRMFGDEGWYAFSPQPFDQGALDVYYWSMDGKDKVRVSDQAWLAYLDGKYPEYPITALQGEFTTIQKKMELIRDDHTTPDTRLSDNPNPYNPATPGVLYQLMTGSPPPKRAQAIHTRLRYFDPERQRPGLPEGIGVLVDTLTDTETSVTFVNLDQIEDRAFIVQAGAYGEHQIKSVNRSSTSQEVDNNGFKIVLGPGAGERLTINMRRYCNQPTLAFPW